MAAIYSLERPQICPRFVRESPDNLSILVRFCVVVYT